jgi:hypothetical protein
VWYRVGVILNHLSTAVESLIHVLRVQENLHVATD